MLSAAKNQGFFVKLSTNGLLYPGIAEKIQGIVDRVYLSLDTTSREEYKTIRGVDGFDKILESIRLGHELQQEICLLYTVTNENVKNLPNMVDFCKNHKVMMYIHPCFSYFGNTALNEEHIPDIKKYFWKPYFRMSLPHMNFHQKGGNSGYKSMCKAGIASFDISPDNCILVPCFQHQQKKLPINGDLQSLYHSSTWKEVFGEAGRYDFCDHCSIEYNFGFSYWNRLRENFIQQNLSYLKNTMVYRSIRKFHRKDQS